MSLSLTSILSQRRAYGSAGEMALFSLIKEELQATPIASSHALHKQIGTSDVLYVAHLDTVEYRDSHANPAPTSPKKITYDNRKGIIHTNGTDTLGADDGAGVWILCEMIKAGIPGGYLFTTGEEVGCIGTEQVMLECKPLLSQYKKAIQFDRKGTDEIIYEMGWYPTASKQFAKELCAVFNMSHRPSDRGTFTDVKVLAEIIPECVNISVGYEGAHSSKETLDVFYLRSLLKKLLEVAPILNMMEVYRKPAKEELLQFKTGNSYYPDTSTSIGYTYEEILQFVMNNPEEAAEYLFMEGYMVDLTNEDLIK